MNFIHKYNSEMGDVDLADQLRGSYRVDHWIRNRKWWWSLLFWGLGVILTNAYIIYVAANVKHFNIKKGLLLSHHEFRRAIVMAWINHEEYQQEIQNVRKGIIKRRKGGSSITTTSSITMDSPSNDTKFNTLSSYTRVSKKWKAARHVTDD